MAQPDKPREDEQPLAVPRAGSPSRRRPYRKPELAEYGSVAKLTQGTFTGGTDALMAGMMMACL